MMSQEGVSMLDVGREKTTEVDRLNNPSWDRAIEDGAIESE